MTDRVNELLTKIKKLPIADQLNILAAIIASLESDAPPAHDKKRLKEWDDTISAEFLAASLEEEKNDLEP
jgi:hypothetical protein